MKRLMIAGLIALGGCATTPQDVLTQGERTDFRSRQTVTAAAACIERNASELKWGLIGTSFPARIRAGKEPGTLEVIYGGDMATGAVAIVRPDHNESLISIWRTPEMLGWLRGEGTIAEQMAKGC